MQNQINFNTELLEHVTPKTPLDVHLVAVREYDEMMPLDLLNVQNLKDIQSDLLLSEPVRFCLRDIKQQHGLERSFCHLCFGQVFAEHNQASVVGFVAVLNSVGFGKKIVFSSMKLDGGPTQINGGDIILNISDDVLKIYDFYMEELKRESAPDLLNPSKA